MNSKGETPIATLSHGKQEELRITMEDQNGRRTIKMRMWFRAKDGQYRPGKHGMQIRAEAVDDVPGSAGKGKGGLERRMWKSMRESVCHLKFPAKASQSQ